MTSRCGRIAALVVALGVSLAGAGSAAASEAPAKHAADWIVSKQQANGAFLSAKQRASDTGETLAAIVAGGASGAPVTKALDYIKAQGKNAATEGAYTGRVIAGIVAGGRNPRTFGGTNYVNILHSQYDATTGSYDKKNFFSDLIGANGANAAKDPLPAAALAYIDAGQCSDGGFAFQDCSGPSDTDTTAWAINVLIASGHKSDAAVARARDFLLHTQNADGGFGFSSAEPATSSDSTGLAIAAIDALGEDATKAPWVKSNGDPVRALVALQTSGGSFRANAQASSGNLESTVNAIPGLAHQSYPVQPAPKAPSPSASPHPTSTPYTAPRGGTEAPKHHHAPVAVDNSAKNPTSSHGTVNATSTVTGASASPRPTSSPTSTEQPRSSVLGFGGITTKRGGISIAAWSAIAAGCAGLRVGIWLLRARLR